MKMKSIVSSLFFLLLCYPLLGEVFTDGERLQGYAVRGDQAWFLFDADVYGEQPEKVVVTGAFRDWSTDMDDPHWQLAKQTGGLWALSVENASYIKIPPSSPFKFRIDGGTWIQPPTKAENETDGNLIFLFGTEPAKLKAELLQNGNIWAFVKADSRPLAAEAYQITDAAGNSIPVAAVLPNTAVETLIVPESPLDPKRVYYLSIPSLSLETICSYDGWFRHMYSDKPLGANIAGDGSSTAFRVFAPRATGMRLYLYKNPTDEAAYQTIDMVQDANGVWEHIAEGDLNGVYYDFTVHGAVEPGNHFYESEAVHISDPYARVSMDTWGKCRVVPATKPATPLLGGIPPLQDVIAYEVHVQDFTDLLPVSDHLKGTLEAMAIPGLKNSKGQSIGFDYLVGLGINVLHLMPVQEYLHWPNEDWVASFKDHPYMKSQAINTEIYQWGYRTSHCFAIESRYRTPGTQPGAEREQFRNLVQAFHDKGIAVIIDIVPNHTSENMDGQAMFHHFNALDKIYYYRTKNLEHIGEYGNEVKTENRPMVQRWLIDQCLHFINEFGIDGFRIDLAGQVDEQTLIALRKAVGEDIIIYGEPWIASNDPAFEANPDWDWYKEDSPITFFQDDARNAFKGPVSNPENKATDRGYAGGNIDERENAMLGLSNRFPEDKTPLSGINYLDIHDNWALADQFATKNFDGRFGVDEDNFKIASVLLYTSLGPIVNHGGTEIMRSKGSAPLEEIVRETNDGVKVYIHGMRDTYNLRAANRFIWEHVGMSLKDKGSQADHAAMHQHWQGLNRLRRSDFGKVFRLAEKPGDDHYQWFAPKNKALLGYVVGGTVAVVMNVSDETAEFGGFKLPAGKWRLVGNNSGIEVAKGVKDNKAFSRIKSGEAVSFSLPPTSFKIWVKVD